LSGRPKSLASVEEVTDGREIRPPGQAQQAHDPARGPSGPSRDIGAVQPELVLGGEDGGLDPPVQYEPERTSPRLRRRREPHDGQEIKDVRDLTNAVAALARKVKDGSPPVCEIHWGAKTHGSDFPFKGVVTILNQRFTYFRPTGEPVRAILTLTFTEYRKPGEDQRETDPELTTRVVKRGDTVTSIAAEVYRDPGLWRVIAQANGLDDPRRLEIGRVLTLPKVR
jgi:hypothetical protein